MKLVIFPGVLLAVFVLWSAPALASSDTLPPLPSTPDYGAREASEFYPPRLPSVYLSLSDAVPEPGQTVTATMTGCTPGETVDFKLLGIVVPAICDANGQAVVQLTMPTEPGPYRITAQGETSGVSESQGLLVQVNPVEAPTLPVTGGSTDFAPLLWVASSALVSGLAFILVVFRRRRPPPNLPAFLRRLERLQ